MGKKQRNSKSISKEDRQFLRKEKQQGWLRYLQILAEHIRSELLRRDREVRDGENKIPAKDMIADSEVLEEMKRLANDYFKLSWSSFKKRFKEMNGGPLGLAFVRELHLVFGIPYEKLKPVAKNIDKKEQHKYFFGEEKICSVYFREKYLLNRKLLPLNNCDSSVEKDKTEFVENFKRLTARYLSPSESVSKVWVSEYLGKGSVENPGNTLSAYWKAKKHVYRGIEKLLTKNKDYGDDPTYIRIIRVPDRILKGGAPRPLFLIKQALTYCRLNTFKHIARCLHKFENDCRIFIIPSNRQASFCLIYRQQQSIETRKNFETSDNWESVQMLSEYYSYSWRSQNMDLLKPSMLFSEEISSVNEQGRSLLNHYESEIEDAVKETNHRVDFKALEDSISESLKEIDEKINADRARLSPTESRNKGKNPTVSRIKLMAMIEQKVQIKKILEAKNAYLQELKRSEIE